MKSLTEFQQMRLRALKFQELTDCHLQLIDGTISLYSMDGHQSVTAYKDGNYGLCVELELRPMQPQDFGSMAAFWWNCEFPSLADCLTEPAPIVLEWVEYDFGDEVRFEAKFNHWIEARVVTFKSAPENGFARVYSCGRVINLNWKKDTTPKEGMDFCLTTIQSIVTQTKKA